MMSCTCSLPLIASTCVQPGLTPDRYLAFLRISCLLCRNSRRQAPILVDLHGLHVSEAILEIIKMRKWIVAAPLDSALLHPTALGSLRAMLYAYHRVHHAVEILPPNSSICIQPDDTIQHSFSAEPHDVSGCAPVVRAER